MSPLRSCASSGSICSNERSPVWSGRFNRRRRAIRNEFDEKWFSSRRTERNWKRRRKIKVAWKGWKWTWETRERESKRRNRHKGSKRKWNARDSKGRAAKNGADWIFSGTIPRLVGIEQVCPVLALIGKYRKRREIGDRVESRVCPFKGKEFEPLVCGNYLMAN